MLQITLEEITWQKTYLNIGYVHVLPTQPLTVDVRLAELPREREREKERGAPGASRNAKVNGRGWVGKVPEENGVEASAKGPRSLLFRDIYSEFHVRHWKTGT